MRLLLLTFMGCRTQIDDKSFIEEQINDTGSPSFDFEDTVNDEADSGGEPTDTENSNGDTSDSEENTEDDVSVDSDNDGLSDEDEDIYGTDPNDPDSDNDGLSDEEEITAGTDPNDADSDDDGLSDGDELLLGTNPNNSDTDNDGTNDEDELVNGTDPNTNEYDDSGNVWDWGDYDECTDCDPADFAGAYDITLWFANASNSVLVCTSNFTVYILTDGTLDFTTSCTSSTGLSFEFVKSLQLDFTGDNSSTEYASLIGSSTLTLPNESLYSETFYSSNPPGGISLITNQFSPYNIFFNWRQIIQTPNGPVEYVVYFSGVTQ
jgi:hypothetical protein